MTNIISNNDDNDNYNNDDCNNNDVDDDDDEGNIVLVNSQDSRLCYKNMCSQETFDHTILTENTAFLPLKVYHL